MNQIPDILLDAEVVVAVADNAKTDENDNKEVGRFYYHCG